MIPRERVEFDRITCQRHALQVFRQTKPCSGEHRKQFVELRGSPQLDDRQVLSTDHVSDVKFESSTTPTSNSSPRRCTR